MLSFKKYLLVVIVAFFLYGCADDSDDSLKMETKGWTVQKLYNTASSDLADKSYAKAIKYYNVLESTYPYGVYAQQGLLDLAYAYYQDDKPELAIPTIDQFISTYPTNINMDYALYLKGFIHYKNDNGLLSRFTKQDLAERDPKGLDDSFKAFSELVNKYPNSKYAPDARDKINRLVNALARGEIFRARYYTVIKAYLAAISRSQNVITNYPNSPYVEEALAIEIKSYQNLGKFSLAAQTYSVLKINFPHSKYLKEDWQNQEMAWYKFWR